MRRFLVAAGATALVVTTSLGVPTAANADEPEDDGLRYEASSTFEFQPDEENVEVTVDISVTNEIPSEGSTYYYFDSVFLPALTEATNVFASSDGSSLSASFDEGEEGWGAFSIQLPNQLTYGETQSLTVQYDLPSQPPRSDGWTRANEAYASFLAFAVGDPGLADVNVIIPVTYEMSNSGFAFDSKRKDGDNVVYYAEDLEDPWNWFAGISAQDDESLTQRDVTIDESTVEIRHWPGDKKWADFTAKQLKTGLPALERVVGAEFPVDDTLVITESGAPHIFGWGGWYNNSQTAIEVADTLDKHVLLHELAHAWFNGSEVTDLWLIEGLAETVSNRALENRDGDGLEPLSVSRDDEGAQPLNAWVATGLSTGGQPSPEDDYGYAASFRVLAKLADDVGDEKFTEVMNAAVNDTLPYAGDEPASLNGGLLNWKRMLDLFEDVGEADSAEKVFRTWIVTDGQKGELDKRNSARERYEKLEADGDGWSPPYQLRVAMTKWEFGEARQLEEGAREVLSDRDEVFEIVEGLGVDEMPGYEAAYESAKSVSELTDVSEQYVDTAYTISDAAEDPGFAVAALNAIGLLGYDLDGTLSDAAEALADGEVDDAQGLADEATEKVDGAAVQGGIRLAIAAAVLLLLWVVLRLRKRRNRRRDQDAERTAAAEDFAAEEWAAAYPAESPQQPNSFYPQPPPENYYPRPPENYQRPPESYPPQPAENYRPRPPETY